MNFKTEQEAVFLSCDSGIFDSENGQKIAWNKIKFANPATYENHELSYRDGLDVSKLVKGQKVKLEIDLEPTNKKSRVVVTGFKVA